MTTLVTPSPCHLVTSPPRAPSPGARFLDRDGRRIDILTVDQTAGTTFVRYQVNGNGGCVMVLELFHQLAQLLNFVPLAPEAA